MGAHHPASFGRDTGCHAQECSPGDCVHRSRARAGGVPSGRCPQCWRFSILGESEWGSHASEFEHDVTSAYRDAVLDVLHVVRSGFTARAGVFE